MRQDELSAGFALSTAAGWNQTGRDWRRIHELAEGGCFAAESATGLVGTSAAIRFGDVAWVAMVLVEPSMRGRGIGTALVRRAIEHCDALGVATVRLDATPFGRPVYERRGFRSDFEMIRLRGDAACEASRFEVWPMESADLSRIGALDGDCSGCHRAALLRKLFDEEPQRGMVVRNGDRLSGFIFSRPGRLVRHVGPCIAVSARAGTALLDAALSSASGPVQIDMPAGNTAAMSWAQSRGLTPQRSLLRMTRGRPISERTELLWAGSGPEKG